MTLYSQKDTNIRKTWLLMTVFLVLIIAIGWIFSYAYGAPEILYIAVGISLLMNIIAYWNSDKIALSMSGAKSIPREGNEYVYRMIENLCITAGLPMPRVYLIESPQINAFATGRNPEHSAVAVTRGAIQKLENEEFEGVLAHEISHIGNRDMLVSTVVVVLAGVVAIVSDIFLRATIWGGRGRSNRDNGGALVLVIALIAAILAPIAAMIIRMAVSRKREYLADASGALENLPSASGIIAFARQCHQASRFTSYKGLCPLDLEFNSAAFAFAKPAPDKGKQYPLNTTRSWKP